MYTSDIGKNHYGYLQAQRDPRPVVWRHSAPGECVYKRTGPDAGKYNISFIPTHTRCRANVGLMLGQSHRRWPNNKPTLVQRFLFTGTRPVNSARSRQYKNITSAVFISEILKRRTIPTRISKDLIIHS